MIDQTTSSKYATTVKAFSRAITREAHALTQRPDLLWQQLYNRLQWEGEGVKQDLALDLTERNARGAKPWLRLKTPYRESEALVRTLEGHTDFVYSVAFSPDGKTIASGSYDNTIKLWDISTDRRRKEDARLYPYIAAGLGLLYDLHRKWNGWNSDIQARIEGLLNDASQKEKLISIFEYYLKMSPGPKEISWILKCISKMEANGLLEKGYS